MVTFWGLGVILFYGVSYFGFQRMRHCQGSIIDMFTPGKYTPCLGTTPPGPLGKSGLGGDGRSGGGAGGGGGGSWGGDEGKGGGQGIIA